MNNLRTFAVAGLSSLLLLGTACSSNKQAEQSSVSSKGDGQGTTPPPAAAKQAEKAFVRFVNGTTSEKDLAFGDATPFTGIGDKDITEYKELPAERHEFKLMAKEDKATPLATNSEGISAGKHYTIFASLDKTGKAELNPEVDDLTAPAAGQMKVRVVNLAPAMDNADLYATGQKSAVVSGVGFDKASDYKEVPQANASLMVRSGMSKKNSAPVVTKKLEAGKLYTIVVFEDKKHKLSTKMVEDVVNAPAGAM